MGTVDMKIFEKHYKELVKFDSFLGMDLSVEEPGRVTYTLEIQQHHLTAPDSAHGGVAAAMMDACLGVAALSHAVSRGNLCATVEFKINYLSRVKMNYILIATGEVKHSGKKLIVSQGDIRNKITGELIATGLGTFTQYPMNRRSDILSRGDQ